MEITLKVMVEAAPALMRILEQIAGQVPSTESKAPSTESKAPRVENPVMEAKAEEPSPERTIPTDDDMKQEMDIYIAKFAGNGWKTAKDSRSTAIRRGCTSAFKEIAKWLGAEKPTALEGEKRIEFLNRLSEIFIEEPKEEGKMPEIVFRPF